MQLFNYIDPLDSDSFSSSYLYYYVVGLVIILIIFLLLKFTNLKKSVTTFLGIRRNPSQENITLVSNQQSISNFNFQRLKKDVEDLKEARDVLTDRLSSAQKVLLEIQVEMNSLKRNLGLQSQNYRTEQTEKHNLETSQPSTRHSPVYANYDSRPNHYSQVSKQGKVDEAYSNIIELYNASRSDQASRARFREKYKPFFINVTNDVDRRRNGNLPPDFRKEADGSYLAVVHDTEEAVVFPNFTLVIVDAVYGPGALGEVFDCPNFDRRFSYPDIRVAKPATFNLTGGDSWELSTKGVLELGQAQDA